MDPQPPPALFSVPPARGSQGHVLLPSLVAPGLAVRTSLGHCACWDAPPRGQTGPSGLCSSRAHRFPCTPCHGPPRSNHCKAFKAFGHSGSSSRTIYKDVTTYKVQTGRTSILKVWVRPPMRVEGLWAHEMLLRLSTVKDDGRPHLLPGSRTCFWVQLALRCPLASSRPPAPRREPLSHKQGLPGCDVALRTYPDPWHPLGPRHPVRPWTPDAWGRISARGPFVPTGRLSIWAGASLSLPEPRAHLDQPRLVCCFRNTRNPISGGVWGAKTVGFQEPGICLK